MTPATAVPTVRLGDYVTIKGGGTPRRDVDRYFRGHIPWVTPKDMKVWELYDAELRITDEALRNSTATLVPTNTVLLVVRSGVLKHTVPVAINRVPVAINQDMKSLECDPALSPEYLARLIKAAQPTILTWVRATTADNYSIDKIRELVVPLPPLDEQRRIAAILDQADELRRKRRLAIEKLTDLREALYNDLKVLPDADTWPLVKVSDVATLVRTGPFGSQLLHSEFVNDGVAVLGIDNTQNNDFSWSQRRFITTAKYRELSRYTVRPGDVLITIMGTCGRCAIVPDTIPLAINTKHLCCITLDTCKCLPDFLHAALIYDRDILAQLGVRERGAVMPGLNMQLIKDTSLRLPPIDIQKQFADELRRLRALQLLQENQLATLNQLFASLQHRAFSGDLTPSAVEATLASV